MLISPTEAIQLMAENILTNPHREEYAIETETVPDLDSVPVQEKPQVIVIKHSPSSLCLVWPSFLSNNSLSLRSLYNEIFSVFKDKI